MKQNTRSREFDLSAIGSFAERIMNVIRTKFGRDLVSLGVAQLTTLPDDRLHSTMLSKFEMRAYPAVLYKVGLRGSDESTTIELNVFFQFSTPFRTPSDPMTAENMDLRCIPTGKIVDGEEISQILAEYPNISDERDASVSDRSRGVVVLMINSRNLVVICSQLSDSIEVRASEGCRRFFENQTRGIAGERAYRMVGPMVAEHMPELGILSTNCFHTAQRDKRGEDGAFWIQMPYGPMLFPVQVKSSSHGVRQHIERFGRKKPVLVYKQFPAVGQPGSFDAQLRRIIYYGSIGWLAENFARSAAAFREGKILIEERDPVLQMLKKFAGRSKDTVSQNSPPPILARFNPVMDWYWEYRDRGALENRKREDEVLQQVSYEKGEVFLRTRERFPRVWRMKVELSGTNGRFGSFYFMALRDRWEEFRELRPDAKAFLLPVGNMTDIESAELSEITERVISENPPSRFVRATYTSLTNDSTRRKLTPQSTRRREANENDKRPMYFKRYILPTLDTLVVQKNEFITRAAQWKKGNLPADLITMVQSATGDTETAKLLAVNFRIYTPDELRDAKRFKNLPPNATEARRELLAHYFPGEFA